MTPAMARTILERAGTTPVEDPALIGFEPETRALDASRDENAIMLAGIVQENRAANRDTRIVIDGTGRLSAWVESNLFWNLP